MLMQAVAERTQHRHTPPATPAECGNKTSPSASLIDLGIQFDAAVARFDERVALTGGSEYAETEQSLWWEARQFAARIAAAPSTDFDGVRIKLRALAWYINYASETEPDWSGDLDHSMMISVLRDVLGYGPGEGAVVS